MAYLCLSVWWDRWIVLGGERCACAVIHNRIRALFHSSTKGCMDYLSVHFVGPLELC